MNKIKALTYLIRFQGFYYLITGIWATFFLSNFQKVTMHTHYNLDFGMHVLAGALIIVLGLFYIYSVKNKNWFKKSKDITYLVMGITLSIVIVELMYLPSLSWNLFWMDLVEELIIFISVLLLSKK
jgi:hypothetical protein